MELDPLQNYPPLSPFSPVLSVKECQAERGVHGGENKVPVVPVAQCVCPHLLPRPHDPGGRTPPSGPLNFLAKISLFKSRFFYQIYSTPYHNYVE